MTSTKILATSLLAILAAACTTQPSGGSSGSTTVPTAGAATVHGDLTPVALLKAPLPKPTETALLHGADPLSPVQAFVLETPALPTVGRDFWRTFTGADPASLTFPVEQPAGGAGHREHARSHTAAQPPHAQRGDRAPPRPLPRLDEHGGSQPWPHAASRARVRVAPRLAPALVRRAVHARPRPARHPGRSRGPRHPLRGAGAELADHPRGSPRRARVHARADGRARVRARRRRRRGRTGGPSRRLRSTRTTPARRPSP